MCPFHYITLFSVHQIWEDGSEEAAAYSGIGIKRLRKMALAKGCNFSISNGTQILINREKFDKYMDKIEKV